MHARENLETYQLTLAARLLVLVTVVGAMVSSAFPAAAQTPSSKRLEPAAPTEPTEMVVRTHSRPSGGVGGLTTGSALGAPECVTTFDEDEPLQWMVGHAHDTFVYSPFWNQMCSGDWVRIRTSAGSNHFHLLYTDPEIVGCQNGDNAYGTPFLQMARGAQECEPIDPLTEPRSHLHTMIPQDVIHIERLSSVDYSVQPFTLSRIQVKDHPVKLCYRLAGPWEAAGPPAEGEVPGQFCWNSLVPGTYDLSAHTSGSIEVTVTLADQSDPNFSLDNVELDW